MIKKEDFPESLTTAYHLSREDKRRLYGKHSEKITVYLQFRHNDVLRIKVRPVSSSEEIEKKVEGQNYGVN
jgi:hypothetical protein